MTEIAADRPTRSFRISVGRGFAWLFLVTLFVLPCVAGPGGAYIALGAAVIGGLVVCSRSALQAALGDPGLWLFPIAFLLLGIAFAATAQSGDDLLALFDFAGMILAIPAFILAVRFAGTRNAMLVSWLALAGSFAAVLMGLYEGFMLGAERASGNSSPIFFSDLGIWLGFLALTGFFAPPARGKLLLALGPLLGVAAALMGGTRGALLVAAALIVVFVVFVAFTSIGQRRQRLGAMLVVLLATVGVATVFLDTDRLTSLPGLLEQTVEGGASEDDSINNRIEFYRSGLTAIGEAPIAGHGWWRRFSAAAPYMHPDTAWTGEGNRAAHLHNDIINFGAGAGAIGILAYLLMLIAPVAGAWFSARDAQRGARLYAGSTLSIGFLAMGLTDSMFVYELPKLVFFLATAVVLGFCRDRAPGAATLVPDDARRRIEHLRPVPAWAVLVAILVLPMMLGTLSSIIAVVFAIIALPLVWRAWAWGEIREQPAMVMFLVAFAVLALVFVVTASEPNDIRFILNFLALAVAPSVYLMTRERPASDAMLMAVLCLAGTIAAFLLAVAVVAILQNPRAQGLFGGPNLMPRAAIPIGFFALIGAFLVAGRWRYLFYLGPVLAVGTTLLTWSRGATLALVPLGIIAAVTLSMRRETRRDILGLGVLVALAAGAVALIEPYALVRIYTAATSIGDVLTGTASADSATLERQAMIAAGWSAFLTSPIIGYGWANLGTAAALADPANFGHLADSMFMFHNDALDFAVAGGVVGIAVYLVLLAAPIVGVFAMPRDGLRMVRVYGALVLSVSFFIFGLTDLTLGYDLTTTIYTFLTALILGMRREATP